LQTPGGVSGGGQPQKASRERRVEKRGKGGERDLIGGEGNLVGWPRKPGGTRGFGERPQAGSVLWERRVTHTPKPGKG